MHNPTSSLVTTKIGHLGFLKRGNCCMCAYLCSHTSNLKKPEILCSPEMIILVELTMELVLKTPFRSLAQVIWNELATNLLGVQVFCWLDGGYSYSLTLSPPVFLYCWISGELLISYKTWYLQKLQVFDPERELSHNVDCWSQERYAPKVDPLTSLTLLSGRTRAHISSDQQLNMGVGLNVAHDTSTIAVILPCNRRRAEATEERKTLVELQNWMELVGTF